MNKMKWLLCAGLVGALAGCGGDTTTDGGTHPDMGPVADLGTDTGTMPAVSQTYVINYLQMPMPDPSGTVIDGFDIDMTSATVCNQMDYTAPAFLGGGNGVDNALGAFLSSLANAPLQTNVDKGTVLLLVEVSDINSYINDDSVGLTFYLGKLQPTAMMPTHVGACPMEPTDPTTDPNCRIAPGQTFDLDSASFSDGMMGMHPLITFPHASIVNGRLKGGPQDFPLTVNLLGASLTLTIHAAQIDLGITSTAIMDGVLGGAIDDMQLLNTLMSVPSLCSYVSTVAPVLGSQSDLMPTAVGPCTWSATDGGTGMGAHHCPANSMCDPATMMCMSCAQASIGIDLRGVTATKGNVVTTPPADGGTAMGCSTDGGTISDGGGPG